RATEAVETVRQEGEAAASEVQSEAKHTAEKHTSADSTTPSTTPTTQPPITSSGGPSTHRPSPSGATQSSSEPFGP
ncbi:hypothetical protein, partial [Agromyces sp. NPDC057865]|uniref:hypothetical protein n=1 Tax=Agromyces sp. NPDC057865 TaxID=3346267 RepID=UPI00366AB03D